MLAARHLFPPFSKGEVRGDFFPINPPGYPLISLLVEKRLRTAHLSSPSPSPLRGKVGMGVGRFKMPRKPLVTPTFGSESRPYPAKVPTDSLNPHPHLPPARGKGLRSGALSLYLLFQSGKKTMDQGLQARGANMIIAIPASATAEPTTSQTCGRTPSTSHSQASAVTT